MFTLRRNLLDDPLFTSFRTVGRLFEEMDRLYSVTREAPLYATTGFPAVDVWTGQEGAVVSAEIPGVKMEDLDVSVLGDILTIRGKRAAPELGENEGFVRQERFTGEFVRTVQLPFVVDPEGVQAEHRHGLLTVRLSRPEADKPRKIAIGQGS